MTSRYFTMAFYSILLESKEDYPENEALEAPDFFGDLHCDQVVSRITVNKREYELEPFFYTPLHRLEAIMYRHEVMRDLEKESLFDCVASFTEAMQEMRKSLTRPRTQLWFLDAVEIYCNAIKSFMKELDGADCTSRGFQGFRDYLKDYTASAQFMVLSSETKQLATDLRAIRYAVSIRRDEGRFTVRKYAAEPDYSTEIEKVFAKFKESSADDYRQTSRLVDDERFGMSHVEAKILEFVTKLHPDIFERLNEFCLNHATYLDETIAAFDREVQFYMAYLEYTADFKKAGLSFCYPKVSEENKEIFANDGFDIALADKLVRERKKIVCNDFYLKGKERTLIVSGPNQGGKTTFARAFGQLHYLASLGLPVPGTKAQTFLFDKLFAHFERIEKVENLRGKLEDDLVRAQAIVEQATARSIIILNEIFASTTLHDEIFLSTKMMEKISKLDALCVWVTFINELSTFGPQIVSMVSAIDPTNPAVRTFKIERRPADGFAYAMAIAQKYGLTYDSIKNRIIQP